MTVTPEIKGTVTRTDPSSEKTGLFGSRAPFWMLRHELDNFMSRFSGDGGLSQAFNATLDMSETIDEIEVRIDVPGIHPDEIEVEISGNTLFITGERKEENEEKGRTYHRIERTGGCFSRTVTLPCEVESNEVQAQCENGVLTVTLPKSESNQSHKITVKPKF